MTALKGRPLSGATLHQSLDELLDHAGDALATWSLVPTGHQDQYEKTVDDIRSGAAALHLSTYGQLLAGAGPLLSHLTGAQNLRTFRRRDELDRLHQLRNTLGALLGAAALHSGDDPATATSALPTIPPRTADHGRPLEPDEVLVVRIIATHGLTDPERLKATAIYALTDAGAYASEATCVTPAHVDTVEAPHGVCVPGVKNRADGRRLELDPWASKVLAELLVLRLALPGGYHRPIGYDGAYAGGSAKASASANGCVTRIFDAAGLNRTDLSALSATYAAVARAYRAHGLEAAAEAAGVDPERREAQVERLLRVCKAPETKTSPIKGGFL
jgi:hypothetical protein